MNWVKRALIAIGIWLLIAIAALAVADLSGAGSGVGGFFSLIGFVIGVIYLIIPLFRRKASTR